MRGGGGGREEDGTTEKGTKERATEKDESLTCGGLMRKPLTQEFLVFSE